jgi:S-adenosylmethionine:tRNA-ribosyltransferase-isomerase (queuine synthetase)
MALSEDTQAIIDRLKAEGDLIRNSGTNSMRAVNIKLDRFEGLFKSINENVVSQTDMMRQQMGIAA